ncbi:MAG: STT3 domain-containing protein [Candidatus Bathyarchaeia archaeon]
MKITDALKKSGVKLLEILSLRPRISHPSLIKGALFLLILSVALGARLLSLRWGFYLNEFDPYFHYHAARYIANNGLASLFSWRDYTGWYPWGRDMPRLSNFGLALTAVALYRILSFLGIPLVLSSNLNPLDPLISDPLYNLCVIFPLIMTALTCLITYFLGRELGGETVGLLSALLLAVDPSYIDRTSLGWFDDETVGIMSGLFLILSFSRAMDEKRDFKSNIIYAVFAGLSLGYLSTSWGAARYLIVMTALFTFILLLRRYTPRLLLSYIITFGLAFSVVIVDPRAGLSFLKETTNLPVYGVLLLLCIAEISRRTPSPKKKAAYISTFIILVIAVTSITLHFKILALPSGKYLYALIPSLRSENPLFESVAEHKPSSWAVFYYNFGVGVIFIPVGVFFAALMATNLSIFMAIYCLTSIYFASSMVRLNILASPSICLLWALALKRVLSPLILSLKEETQHLGRKARIKPFEKELIGGLLIIMFAFFVLTHVFGTAFLIGISGVGPRFLTRANTPATLSGASLSFEAPSIVRDWIDALTWMRENLPPSPSKPGESGTVVASWWDYGYWITVVANKTTLADNGTINGTRIMELGRMFMSNETEAIKMLKKYNVTHVVVYVTFDNNGRDAGAGGDEGKWRWMAKIPGLDDNLFGNLTLGWDWIDSNNNGRYDQYDQVIRNTLGQNTVLYKLMTYGKEKTLQGYSTINLEHFRKAYFSQKEREPKPAITLSDGTSLIPLVCVYEVVYD